MPPDSNPSFSQTATWTVTDFSAEAMSCYDFDTQVASDCSDNNWDIKLENQPRGIKLWSNSGGSGTGDGGVFGPMDWSDLVRYDNGTQDSVSGHDITMHYNADHSGSIFDQQPWYKYNLKGMHQLYPNNQVYLITSDSGSPAVESSILQPIYAMQIVNYYNDSGASGYPTVHWIDTALFNKVQSQTINTSNKDDWLYFDLATEQTTTDKNGAWQVGFKRSDVILNGGDSGTRKIGGYLAATPTGYYNGQGKLIAHKLNLDFGWYTYSGVTHQLTAKAINDSQGVLLRSAASNSYARVSLDKINYPNVTGTTPSSWVFNIGIQPAK